MSEPTPQSYIHELTGTFYAVDGELKHESEYRPPVQPEPVSGDVKPPIVKAEPVKVKKSEESS